MNGNRQFAWRSRDFIPKGMIAFLLLIGTACSRPDSLVNEIIQSVKAEYAPDKRTVLFDVLPDWKGKRLILSGETSSPEAKQVLFRQLDHAGIEAADSVRLLPGPEEGSAIFGIVRLSVSNLRVKPAHSAEMATQVLLGTPLKILRDGGDWLQVQTPEQYIAWTQRSGLVRLDSAGFAAWKRKPKLIFTAETGLAFRAPASQEIVSDLVMGNMLALEGERDAYFQVSFPDGRTGFIAKNEAQLLDRWLGGLHPDGESIFQSARTMMGVPYLWGGTSFKGVDCSGFTKTAYFMNGIILPRDASQQVLVGEPVAIRAGDTVNLSTALRNLQKGDLIFFTNDPARRNEADARITHVGIYIENGEFIHSSGLVHRSSLVDTAASFSAHHAKTLTQARRVLTEAPRYEHGLALISAHPLYATGRNGNNRKEAQGQ